MAAVTMRKIFRPLMLAGLAAIIAGCPMDLALKTTIKSLAAPPDVGSLKVITPASKTFLVTWVDPSDKDIDHIEISFTTPFATNPPPAPISVSTGVQKATVTVPLNSVWYFITVKTVDKAGNKSPGKTPFNLFASSNSKTIPYTSGLAAYEQLYTVSGGVLPGTPSYYHAYTYSGGSSGNLMTDGYYSGTYPSGTLQYHYSYTYDSNGNMTKYAYYSDTPTPNTLQWYYVYTNDQNGNLLTQAYYNSTGVESNNETYSYDTSGNLTSEQYYSSPGVEASSYTYYYDQNNHVVKQVYTDFTNSANNAIYTISWNTTTNFPTQITISGGATGTETYAVTQTSLIWTYSYSSSTYSANYKVVENFNSYGLLTQDTFSGSSTSGGSTYTYNDTSTYNYDISGNKTDEVDSNNGTVNGHEIWPQYY